jgi:hypothetical protein
LNRSAFSSLTRLDSVENDANWLSRVRSVVGSDPRINLLYTDGAIADFVEGIDLDSYDLVLVDDSSNPFARGRTIRKLARKRSHRAIVAVHDFEQWQSRLAARPFLHRFRITAFNPNVGVVWYGNRIKTSQVRALGGLLRRNAGRLDIEDVDGWVTVLQDSDYA